MQSTIMTASRLVRSGVPIVLLAIGARTAPGQSPERGFFVGYETLEMAMNEFKIFAGEVGFRLSPKHQLRLTIMEVDLTERHLASKWESFAIDGPNVVGYFQGYEAHVDRFFKRNWYVSGAVGFYKDSYRHTQLDQSLENKTFTLGSGIGYTRSNLLGIKGLYVNVDVPVRYYFNPIKETKWGETTIMPHVVVNNLWVFAGFKL